MTSLTDARTSPPSHLKVDLRSAPQEGEFRATREVSRKGFQNEEVGGLSSSFGSRTPTPPHGVGPCRW